MERRKYLQIPGPTNVPDRILRSLSKPLLNHRGEEFEELVDSCVKGLKKIYKTENDILIFPSSGSGILEASIVNLFSRGDTVAIVKLGVFSDRMASIAENHGLNVIPIEKEWGEAVTKSDIKKVLENDKDKEIKAICLPHNETSTGVKNDIKSISEIIKKLNHPALVVVDAISSLASLELETDKWNLDVVVSSSQKGLMLPPGLGIVSISKGAWDLIEKSTMSKWYWDFKVVKERMKGNQFPYTPSTSLLFGLKESIDMILDEELENVWNRHELMTTAVRNSSQAMGLKLLANDKDASNTVTAIFLPKGIKYIDLARVLSEDYNIIIGGGLKKLKEKIFRIGHLGSLHHVEVYGIMGALEMALFKLGYKVELGTAAKSVAETFLEDK
ncbi:pyridoxal-phosphate-dependent aminotransferase family protein [Senegalia massiliensis]|uniref:pyridoxal-phosphate-dependent aminotransferase family protein n=1 Tax=Senegalia massiliensis TaxID=1720316 RepID=UPI00102FD92E|nr:alanine--glyoxylate aminotransferase family protein [Senegalia massiliensis]